MYIRKMAVEDINQVVEIEEGAFQGLWTCEMFKNELLENDFAFYLVGEVEGKVVAFCGARFVVDQAHIVNFAVVPCFRGQGLGEELFRQMVECARFHCMSTISLEVRVGNVVAQGLYEKLDFVRGGVRKGYYVDNDEDAFVFYKGLD